MFRTVLANLLSFIFTLLVVPVVLVWGVYSTFFNAEFYQGDFVDVAHGFIVEELPTMIDLGKIQEFPDLSGQDLKELFGKVFLREDVAEFLNVAVESFVRSLEQVENQTVKLRVSLNLISKKRERISAEIADFLYDRLPRCVGDGIADENGVANVNSGFSECIPENLARIDFVSKVSAHLDRAIFADLPNEFAVDFAVPEGVDGDVLGFLKQTLSWLFIAALLFLILDLFLLSMVIMGPWYRILRYLSRTVLVPATLLLIMLAVFRFSPEIFQSLYLATAKNLDPQLLTMVKAVLGLFLGTLAGNLILYVVPAFCLSSGLWILAVYYQKKNGKKAGEF